MTKDELQDSSTDKTVKLERHFDDGYGTTYCLSQIHMSLAQFHGFLESWVDDSFFDINSEDSLIDFLKEEDNMIYDGTGKLNSEQWYELMVEIPSTGIDTSGFGDNAGNTVDDLKIFVNNELIVTL
jgi:hypothetical protein